MAKTAEILNHRLTSVVLILTLGGFGLGYMDTRHASATDVQDLVKVIQSDRIERAEYIIEDLERRSQNIERTPLASRSAQQSQELVEIELVKARQLRKMDRMLEVR